MKLYLRRTLVRSVSLLSAVRRYTLVEANVECFRGSVGVAQTANMQCGSYGAAEERLLPFYQALSPTETEEKMIEEQKIDCRSFNSDVNDDPPEADATTAQ